MRYTYLLAFALAASVAVPIPVTKERPPIAPIEDLTRTAVVCEAAGSTVLLPFDLSAVRLRRATV